MKWPTYNQKDWTALVATVGAHAMLTASTFSFYPKEDGTWAYPTTTSTGISSLGFIAYEPDKNKMHMLWQSVSGS
jgi:hypothetical protein